MLHRVLLSDIITVSKNNIGVETQDSFVQQMSQCEGMQNVVKAGNVAALGRKSLTVFRKQAAAPLKIFDLEHRFKTAAFCDQFAGGGVCPQDAH